MCKTELAAARWRTANTAAGRGAAAEQAALWEGRAAGLQAKVCPSCSYMIPSPCRAAAGQTHGQQRQRLSRMLAQNRCLSCTEHTIHLLLSGFADDIERYMRSRMASSKAAS